MDQARLQDISETFYLNELAFTGLGSALFVVLWRSFSPIRHPTYADFLSPHRIEKAFLPGLVRGAALSTTLLLVLAALGFHQVIGFYLAWEQSPSILLGFVFRTISLFALIYAEEFIFRHRLLSHFRMRWGDSVAVVLTSAFYLGIKNLQFDPGVLQSAAFTLVSIILARRVILNKDFAQGAGLYAGLLLVIHPLASLPIFGNEYQGFFLIKSQGLEGIEPSAARWISGGAGGPFGSIFFLMIVGIEAYFQENTKFFTNLWNDWRKSRILKSES